MIEEMNKVKALFPDNVEKIIISKDDYDRLTGELTLENIELKKETEILHSIINEIREVIKWAYEESEYGGAVYSIEEILDKAGKNNE